LGQQIEENERAELLLQSLPDSYDQLIINLTNNILSDYLVFDDVAATILEEENIQKNEGDINSSNQAEALLMSRGRSTEHGYSGSQMQGRSKSRSKKTMKCYNCGRKGHFKRDCWFKKGIENITESSKPQGCVASTSEDGDVLYSEAVTVSTDRKELTEVWLMDSGATWRTTLNRDWFHTYEPIFEGSVFMGNDHALEIAGIGTIKLKMYDGSIHTISGVRYVKGLKKNLLSVGQFDSLGYKIRTNNGIMKIVKEALVVLKARKIVANLIVLMEETHHEADASIALASPAKEKTMMWHKKLGHMSKKGLKILSDQKLLLALTKVTLPFYEHYVTSKQHRLKFGTSTTKSKCILDLINSDVWQAPVISLGGARYFVSFIDDFSRRCWVYLIRRKVDVLAVFKTFKARVELESEKKIKCLRTDNGGEYTSDEFDNFYQYEGIKR